ncbi:EamA family transporter [Reyranella sp.]|uniref:EamA family transporter n=1 Tax=Reyranella sp. TaxID=1929291 RepID=UPI003BA8BB50
MIPLSGLWIPLTVFAAAAQTVRNTAQRHLTAELGTLGATLVRFLYGMPVLAMWLCLVLLFGGSPQPALTWIFGGWVVVAALSQMAGTALLLRAMAERSFAIGLVYSKSEVIQVALFSVLFLGETLSAVAVGAIAVATLGVVLLTPRPPSLAGARRRWADPAAFYGLASGSAFAVSVVGYRGANLALDAGSPFLAAAETLFWSQLLQAVLLCGWLLVRSPAIVLGALRQWRVSTFAGIAGASASLANVTALALAPASQVRTLILIEVVFSYFVSRRIFRESMSHRELAGIILVMAGVVLILSTAG